MTLDTAKAVENLNKYKYLGFDNWKLAPGLNGSEPTFFAVVDFKDKDGRMLRITLGAIEADIISSYYSHPKRLSNIQG